MKRMLLHTTLSLTALTCVPIIVAREEIVLGSNLIRIVDGTFITADTIEAMQKFQRKLIDIVMGEKDSGNSRVGRYEWRGKRYSVRALKELEASIALAEHMSLTAPLQAAKNDFIETSIEFQTLLRGSKKIVEPLVINSCEQRNRTDSVLVEWAHASEADEAEIFNRRVTNFEQLDLFLTDLLNFLGDLVRSCPQAQQQFKARLQKFAKMRELVEQMNIPTTSQMAFLKYVKMKHLDTLKMEEITATRLAELHRVFTAGR